MLRPKTLSQLESRVVFGFFALVFVAYSFVYPYVRAVNNPNENVRTFMTMAIVEEGTFRIDNIVLRNGWVNDMARAPDKKTGEPHLYSVKAPAVSYMGVPVYWVVRHFLKVPGVTATQQEKWVFLRNVTFALRLFAVQLPCFFFLVWFEKWLRLLSRDLLLRLSAVAAVGLGTNYLAYALMFSSHSLFGVSAFLSFGIVTAERIRFARARERRLSRAFLAGFFAGFATLLEYHALPVSLVLALYAFITFYRPTRLAGLALGGGINVAALMFFQWKAFGSPFTPGHRLSENPEYAHLLSQGLFGIGKPSWQVAKDITFSRAFGFLGTSSFMWLGALALPIPWILYARAFPGTRNDRRKLTLATVFWGLAMVILWTTVSAAINWRGGWTIGPRYLGAAPPFFAFGAVLALETLSGKSRARRTLARAAATGLALASIGQSGLVSVLYNSLPESVTRPLPQFVLPLLRTSFVPHHILEPLGVMSPLVFFFVCWAMFTSVLVISALRAPYERVPHYVARLLLSAVFACLGVWPAFSEPRPAEEGDGGKLARHDLTVSWEPEGRDHIAVLRVFAERHGSRAPCAWLRLAELEQLVSQDAEAARDEARAAPTTRESCR